MIIGQERPGGGSSPVSRAVAGGIIEIDSNTGGWAKGSVWSASLAISTSGASDC